MGNIARTTRGQPAGNTVQRAKPKRGTTVIPPISNNPSGQSLQPASPRPKKPSFHTAIKAYEGDKASKAELKLYEDYLKAKKAGDKATRDVQESLLFGTSRSTIHKSAQVAPADPLSKPLNEMLNPLTIAHHAAADWRKGKYLSAGLGAASILPIGPLKGLKALDKLVHGVEGAGLATRFAKVDQIMPKGDYLYHSVPAAQLDHISEHGLTPSRQFAGQHPGVYWSETGSEAGAKGKDTSWIRVKRKHVETAPSDVFNPTQGIGGHVSHDVVSPDKLEYLGKDGKWHGVTGDASTVLEHIGSVANAPRSLMASFDLSAPFRQGLIAGMNNPVLFAKNFGPMFKALISEKKFGEIMQEISARPSFEAMIHDGIQFTEMGKYSKREEQFSSNLAELITGGKRGPVRASGRAYVGFLNKMRADLYDHLIDVAREEGALARPNASRDIARFVNVATGRGELGKLEGAANALNAVMFSPRLFASRINMLYFPMHAGLDPFARKQAMKSMLRLIGAGSTVLGIAALAGAKVATDPRNPDFGKMKFGNTRIDLWGGHQQFVRLVSQIASGSIISSTTGEKYRLSGGRNLSRWDITERFLAGKAAPTPGFIYNFFKGTDFAGRPFDWKREAITRIIPLIIQDVNSTHADTGSIPASAGAAGLASVGFGVQTYGPKPEGVVTPGEGSYPGHQSGGLGRTRGGNIVRVGRGGLSRSRSSRNLSR